jgi:hypothetical protein
MADGEDDVVARPGSRAIATGWQCVWRVYRVHALRTWNRRRERWGRRSNSSNTFLRETSPVFNDSSRIVSSSVCGGERWVAATSGFGPLRGVVGAAACIRVLVFSPGTWVVTVGATFVRTGASALGEDQVHRGGQRPTLEFIPHSLVLWQARFHGRWAGRYLHHRIHPYTALRIGTVRR